MLARQLAGRRPCWRARIGIWPAASPSTTSARRCTSSTTGSSTCSSIATSTSCSSTADDVERPVTLPGGRLREPLDTLVAADAIVCADDVTCDRHARAASIPRVSRAAHDGRRRGRGPRAGAERRARARRHRAPAAVLRRDLRAAGWTLARDAGVSRSSSLPRRATSTGSSDAARAAGAARVLTTEKDFVRLAAVPAVSRCRSTGCRLQWSPTRSPSSGAGLPARLECGSRHHR